MCCSSPHSDRFLTFYCSLFSVSSSAYDVVLRQKVAVKKLSRPFQSLIHSRRSYRELRLLKHMKHENVSAPHKITQRQTCLGSVIDQLVLSLSLSLSLQVIGLLDVFTPAATLEDFNELWVYYRMMLTSRTPVFTKNKMILLLSDVMVVGGDPGGL